MADQQPTASSSNEGGAPALGGYMPQLDGLRTLAVATVIVHHYWPSLSAKFRLGQVGVPLFFVLSGFLITGILLRCRARTDRGDQPLGTTLRDFYARRSLRIFPLYLAVLAVLWVTEFVPAHGSWAYLFTYTANFRFAHIQATQGVGHFWSLCVEEQFYLVWPWVVLLAPRRMLLPVFIAAVAVAPPFRAWATHVGWNKNFIPMLTPSALDKLALGAVLALVSDPDFGLRRWRAPLIRWALLGGLALALLGNVLWSANRATSLAAFAQPLGGALVFTWLVGRAATGFGGRIGAALSWRPVTYLGTISYGIYVYHPLVRRLFNAHFPIENLHLRGLAMVAVTLVVAAVSFHLFEAPINGLKRHFQGTTAPGAPAEHTVRRPQRRWRIAYWLPIPQRAALAS